MDKLWVDGQLADLTQENRAAITFQTWDLLAFDSRHSPFSQGLVLPDTENNRKLLGFPLEGHITTIPYTRTAAMYEADGIFIVGPGGYIIVERLNSEGDFECTIYAASFLFWSTLKGKMLSDLTSIGSMNWLLSDIVANGKWSNWPVIDWNEEMPTDYINDNPEPSGTSPAMYVDFTKMYPGEYLKTIIEAILTENGYEIHDTGSSAWTDSLFQRMFVPCIKQLASSITATQMAQAECTFSSIRYLETILASQTYAYLVDPDTPFIENYQNILYTDTDPAGVQTDVLYYNVRSPGTYAIQVTIDITWGVISYTHRMAFEVWNPVTGQALFGEAFTILNGYGAGSATLEINRAGIEISEIGIICVRIYDAAWEASVPFTVGNGTFKVLSVDPVNTAYAYDFDIALNLPELSQAELFKIWLHMTGAMLWVDEESKKVYVYQFKEIYNTTPQDWSPYFDSIEEMNYHPDGIGQRSIMKYTNDEGVWELKDEHIALISDQALPEEQTIIQIPMSATDDVLHGNGTFQAGGTPTAKIKLRKAGVPENEITGRILVNDELDSISMPVTLYDPSLDVARDPCFVAKADGLSWDDLAGEYYTELFARALSGARVFRANMLLPATVVRGWRANIPVYIKQLSGNFYVNKIENYRAGDMCTVELIKL